LGLGSNGTGAADGTVGGGGGSGGGNGTGGSLAGGGITCGSNGGRGGPAFRYLGNPEATFTVPPRSYFALGDNSYHSRDSRDWGGVPEINVAGRGLLVYWPFSERWGLIR
jgi:hypothetical protein